MTSSLLHSVPPCLHGTAEGRPAAATPAPSPAPDSPAPLHVRRTRRMGTQTRRASPITRSGVARTSTWPWAPAIVQAAAAGLRRATSFAHQHLLFHPFAAA